MVTSRGSTTATETLGGGIAIDDVPSACGSLPGRATRLTATTMEVAIRPVIEVLRRCFMIISFVRSADRTCRELASQLGCSLIVMVGSALAQDLLVGPSRRRLTGESHAIGTGCPPHQRSFRYRLH